VSRIILILGLVLLLAASVAAEPGPPTTCQLVDPAQAAQGVQDEGFLRPGTGECQSPWLLTDCDDRTLRSLDSMGVDLVAYQNSYVRVTGDVVECAGGQSYLNVTAIERLTNPCNRRQVEGFLTYTNFHCARNTNWAILDCNGNLVKAVDFASADLIPRSLPCNGNSYGWITGAGELITTPDGCQVVVLDTLTLIDPANPCRCRVAVVHDVAITRLDATNPFPRVGQLTSILVTVTNQGDVAEPRITFRWLINGVEQQRFPLSLDVTANINIILLWTPRLEGNYTISAEVQPVPGETDIADNSRSILITVLLPPPTSTPSPTRTPTATATQMASATPTATPTLTPSPSPTERGATATPTVTPSPSITPSPTDTPTASPTPTASITPLPTATPTLTSSPSPTGGRETATPTDTGTPSPTPSATATSSPTATATPSATLRASDTPTATATVTPSQTPTPTPTDTATDTPSPTPTQTPRLRHRVALPVMLFGWPYQGPFDEIAYDDGQGDFLWTSLAPGAAAVRFTPPRTPWLLNRVRVHGHYTTANSRFDLQVWDANRQVVYANSYQYDRFFQRNRGSWAEIPLSELTMHGDFYVVVAPNTESGGPVLYIDFDATSPFDGRSYWVDVTTRQDYEGPFDDRDWLIRAVGYPRPTAPTPIPEEIAYDDGTSEQGWSAPAPGAAAVRFVPAGPGWRLTEARIYGSYAGGGGTFNLAVWDPARQPLYQATYSYDLFFKRGVWSWASIPLPALPVSGDFYLVVMPNATAGLHTLYLGEDDTPPAAGRSFYVDIDSGDVFAGPYTDRNWMIRARGRPGSQ
jgi:hypothetical protein